MQEQEGDHPELRAISDLQLQFQNFFMLLSSQARNFQRNARPGFQSSDYDPQKFADVEMERVAAQQIAPASSDQAQSQEIERVASLVTDNYQKLLDKINDLPDFSDSQELLHQRLQEKEAQNQESIRQNQMAKQQACFLFSNLELAKNQILNPKLMSSEVFPQDHSLEMPRMDRRESSGAFEEMSRKARKVVGHYGSMIDRQ